MDRYTAAALGQNLSGAFSEIGQMFAPRMRAAAEQQRLTNEGLGLKNEGFAINNQYAPKVFDSEIALNQARTQTEGSQQALYGAQTKNWDVRNQGLSDLYASAGPAQIPQVNIPYQGVPAPNRYNNPGGAYPSAKFVPYGLQGKGIIGGGHPIGYYPNVESGIAANMAHFKQMNPVGKTVGEMRNYWVTGKWGGSKPLSGMNENEVITQEKLNDPVWMGNWMRATAQDEGYRGGLPDDKVASGFTYYQSGGVPDLSRTAILSSVAGGGGDPQQLTNALNTAKAADIFYNPNSSPDDIRRGQAAIGVANPGFNTVQGQTAQEIATGAPKLENERAIAAGNAQMKFIGDLYGGGNRRGDGSMLGLPKTAPNSFNDLQKVNEMAQAASFKVFGVPVDEDGAPTEDPYAPTRRAWSQSYSNAMSIGMSPIEAEAAANVHHFGTDQPEINSENTFRFGFGKDPSLPAIKNTEPLQASQVFGAQDDSQVAAIAAAVPGLFGLPVQTPGISNSGAAVTGVDNSAQQPSKAPVAPQQPAAEPARPLRASDQFKAKEGSTERKAREKKEKEIASLESEIQGIVQSLQSGEVSTSQVYTPFSAFSRAPEKVKLSNDGYNKTLDRLKEMESRLEKLKGGNVQAGQTANNQQTIRRYNPATGAIE